MILLNINREYKAMVTEIAQSTELRRHIPPMSYAATDRFLNIIDCMSLLLQHGIELFYIEMLIEGGTYVRVAFIFIGFLFKEMNEAKKLSGKSLTWIFGL